MAHCTENIKAGGAGLECHDEDGVEAIIRDDVLPPPVAVGREGGNGQKMRRALLNREGCNPCRGLAGWNVRIPGKDQWAEAMYV